MHDIDLRSDARLAALDAALAYAPESLPHADLRELARAWRERAKRAEAEVARLRKELAVIVQEED